MPTTVLSASVPSGFRFRAPSSPPTRRRSFFAPRLHDAAEGPAPAVDSAAAKTRLEVLKGWEVNFAVLSLYAASFLALLYVVFKLEAVAVEWHQSGVVLQLSGVEEGVRWVLEAASVMLPIGFVASLMLYGAVTDEQIWTLGLLAVGLLATNPLNRRALTVPPGGPVVPVTAPRERVGLAGVVEAAVGEGAGASLIWNEAVYTAVIYLYLLLAAHSYRVFQEKRIHTLAFYAPKLCVALGYFLVKVVAGFKADVSLGLVPYARVVTWLRLVHAGRASLRITLPVLLTTGLDTAFAFWLVREVAVTARFLATVPYVENRAKQLGFRCFVYQTLAFCFSMIGLSLLIMVMVPRSFIIAVLDDPREHFFELEPPVARLALAFVYFTWTLVLAFVNLPPQPVLPFARELVHRFLFLVRNSRAASWMGWVDIVDTVDAEDSSYDGDVRGGVDMDERSGNQLVLPPGETAPFRYRHRELFNWDLRSMDPIDFLSPLRQANPEPSRSLIDFELSYADLSETSYGADDLGKEAYEEKGAPGMFVDGTAPGSSHRPLVEDCSPQPETDEKVHPYSTTIDIPSGPEMRRSRAWDRPDICFSPPPMGSKDFLREAKRLLLRKNLFVMETQVMLANAAYLSYIPGNDKEERVKEMASTPTLGPQSSHLFTGSLANDLDDLARQMESDKDSFYARHNSSRMIEVESQPDSDDGSMFLVDPYEMALKYGYRIHKYISDTELNTHAIVLVNATRVIVAFSGTRNVTNWGMNANLNRALLDEKLSRFEYELSSEAESLTTDVRYLETDAEDPFAIPMQDFTLTKHTRKRPRHSRNMRRSKSEERLSAWTNGSSVDDEIIDRYRGKAPTSYGTLSWESEDGLQDCAAETEEEESDRARFITHQGVSRVASTFARELMTFGQPKVHEGFMTAYLSLRKRVMGVLVELYRGTAFYDDEAQSTGELDESTLSSAYGLPIFFTGHSLGGALATFASYEAARYFRRIGIRSRHDVSCTTFGCPRIGNEAFKARYERLVETHWRFEIASDPVPKVPTTLLNYQHVGVHVLIDQSGMLLIDPSFIEVQWWGKLTNLYLGYRLHARASYCMALRNYCKLYKGGAEDLSECFWPFPIRIQTRGLFVHTEA